MTSTLSSNSNVKNFRCRSKLLIFNFSSRIKAQNSQLVSLTSRTVLTGSKHFRNLAVEGNWFVDTLDVAGLFNDVDVSSWKNDTILKTGRNF
jgi:hypothetical protein